MQKSGRGTFFRHLLLTAASIAGLTQMQAADAIQFSLDYGSGIEGTLNTSVTVGGAIRTQGRAQDLLGKANLNKNVCAGAAQSCQGVFRDQSHPAATLAKAPGAASANADDGDWNYHRGEFVEAPLKVTQDLKLTYGSLGFFAKALYFYDFVNNNFTEYHPNRVTPQNKASVGTRGQIPGANTTFDQVFGPGAVVRNKRTDGEVLRQIGTDFQLFDAYLYGQIPLGERNLTFKIGRQTVNWGQSLVFPINSINQANPVNANNLFRTGFTLEELYQPLGMVFLSTEPFQGATLEGFYDLEWQPVEAPAPGSFYSNVDIGSNNAINTVGINFGGNAEDPSRVATPQENPLSGLTNTTVTMLREPDREPKRWGQFGVSFRYYAEGLNNGTDLGLYYMNYHSQLPYLSTHASNASCARAEGNSLGLNAYDPISLIVACPDLPITHLHGLNGGPDAATSNAVPIDTVKFFLEYPENIHLFGLAFATTLGDYSIQGEVAYRPNAPMQIANADVAFASLQPMLTRCHDPNLPRILPTGVNTSAIQNAIGSLINALGLNIGIPNLAPAGNGCTGSTTGLGTDASGNTIPYAPSDFIPGPGVAAYKDTFDLLVGHADGSARSFPSFLVAYRGGKQGEVAPNSYIQGYERFKTFQFNLGLTKVIGATDNFIGADQVIMVGEFGANWTPGLPAYDVLQIQGPGAYYHASAGADGSGADGSKQACSTTPDCSVGPDGLRFNPHQQDTSYFADRFSWGYRLIAMIRYESVFPGISFAPRIILRHDVHGTMPDPAASLVEGRKEADVQFEIRYKEALSFTPGYTWFTGAGDRNQLRDRDFAEFFVKYQF